MSPFLPAPNHFQPTKSFGFPSLLLLPLGLAGGNLPAELITAPAADPAILEQIDVAPVWSVHQAGPPELLTRDGQQYVAYFDHDRFLTLAQRSLDSTQWVYHRFPVQMGWQTGSHAKLSLALDRQGYIHLACYRRGLLQEPPAPPAALYYRSLAPHSIADFESLYMLSPDEKADYPTFKSIAGTLYFTFRLGGSGRGDQKFYRYDDNQRRWSTVLDTPLLDGGGERSPYVAGGGLPQPGPDGRWHLIWMWRSTPCHSTNNTLSYVRTVGSDLSRWETAAGVPVTPPFTINHRELWVDAAPEGGGLSNPLQTFGWDAQKRLVISYHRFAENGTSQIYNTRFEDGVWRPVAATRWSFVWGDAYLGTGALNVGGSLRLGPVTPRAHGELTQYVWNHVDGGASVVLDENSLAPLRHEPAIVPSWRQQISQPESSFIVPPIPVLRRLGGAMQVELIADTDGSQVTDGTTYVLRWEHGGANRDKPVPPPWPEPTPLRVYKIAGPQ